MVKCGLMVGLIVGGSGIDSGTWGGNGIDGGLGKVVWVVIVGMGIRGLGGKPRLGDSQLGVGT